MELGLLEMLFILSLLVLGLLLHMMNLEQTFRKITELCKIQISRGDLYKEMFVVQGSNFNALVVGAWVLFFLAFAFFFFLTPSFLSQYSYFRLPSLASGIFGFLYFGLTVGMIVILTLCTIASIYPSIYIYGIYEISKQTKVIYIMTIPLLWLSLLCSVYAGTIYPEKIPIIIEAAAFLSIIASELILLSPIFIVAKEAVK